jgi:hypothetical protein
MLKLVSGEEVMTDIIDQTNEYTIKNPVRFFIGPEGPTFMPWPTFAIFTEQKEFSLPKTSVMFMAEMDSDTLNTYNAQYGSGLVIADTKLKY